MDHTALPVENIEEIEISDLFPHIVVHAPVYETDAPKLSPKCTFLLRKNRAISYLSACHCRDPKISYQFDTTERLILSRNHAFLEIFKHFKPN